MKLLEPAENYPEKYWLSYDHEDCIDHLKFQEGQRIVAEPLSVKFLLKNKVSLNSIRKYDYLFSDGPDVVSSRLANIFQEMNLMEDIQLVQASVMINGNWYDDYFAVNYMAVESAFDMEKSIFKPLIKSMPNGPKRFSNIVLSSAAPVHSVFRASESMSRIIVSDQVADFIKSKLVVGICFVDGRESM